MADPRDPYKLSFAMRQEIAAKLADEHGLTRLYALQLVNSTLRHLRAALSAAIPQAQPE